MTQNGFLGTIGWIKGNLMSNPNLKDKGYSNENFYPGAPNIPNSGSENIVKLEWIGFKSAIPSIASKKVKISNNVSWVWDAEIGERNSSYTRLIGDGDYTTSNGTWANGNQLQIVSNNYSGDLNLVFGSSYETVSCDTTARHTYMFQGASTRQFKIDGTVKTTMPATTFSTDMPFRIWHGLRPINKYYSLQIYENGVLVEKIVPVLNNGKPYFMDEIDGTMYPIETEDFFYNIAS